MADDDKQTMSLFRKMKDGTIVFFQLLSYFFFLFFFRPFLHIKRTLPDNISRLNRGSLLVANHQAKTDPFIVMGYLPLLSFLKLIPVRFPADNHYMKIPLVGSVLRLFGCYDVGGNTRERMLVLLRTCELIRSGKTVFLFPEGEIAQSERVPFQKGINFFIREAKAVIFVRIDGFNPQNIASLEEKERRLSYGEVCDTELTSLDVVKLQDYFDLLTESRSPFIIRNDK